MAKKKKNEIIEEQRRARQEFLNLKKMQSGELEPEPKPSEISLKPRTAKEKGENFWFHYKWHTLGAIALIIVLAIAIVQLAGRTSYDMKVVLFAHTVVGDSHTELISDYFEGYCTDLNGDGEVNVQVINCTVDDEGYELQFKNTIYTRILGIINAEKTAMLYVVDDEAIEYFDENIEGESFFDTTPYALPENFYEATCYDEGEDEDSYLPENLKIACRRLKGTLLESNKQSAIVYDESLNIIEQILG